MRSQPQLLIFLLFTTYFTATHALEQCSIVISEEGEGTSTCPEYYDCIAGVCVHKDIFPMPTFEIVGTILIMIVTGFSNAAGSGGSTLTTLLLLIFFQYTENRAVMIAYALVFGGALGNFVNTGFKINPKTGRPFINYDVILACMPSMIFGSSIGVVLNRMAAPVIITVGLVIVMYLSVGKIYHKAKKEYKEEALKRKEKADQSPNSDDSPPARRFPKNPKTFHDEEEMLISEGWQSILREEYTAIPKTKMAIIIVLLISSMALAIIKGSKKVDSILGIQYCSSGYWGVFAAGLLSCVVFSFMNRRLVRKVIRLKKLYNMEKEEGDFNITDESITKLSTASVIAGILAGLLGMGGGTVMGPVLLSMDANIENVVATSGFFVVQTSFMTLFQSALYGDTPIMELLFFLGISFIGSYGISFVIKSLIKWYKRPSIALFILLSINMIGLVAMPAFEIYKSYYDMGEMFEFSPVC